MVENSSNIVWHGHKVERLDREKLNGHRSVGVWLTGLSGSGKSTIASLLEERIFQDGAKTYILDGDNIRTGLSSDLGFSDEDRVEQIRRVAEVTKLFIDAGIIVLSAFISPFASERSKAKEIVGAENFIEVFVKCDLKVCEERDPKGLYKKARAGEIPLFTGIDSPYEDPESPDIVVDSGKLSVEECVEKIFQLVKNKISLQG